MVEPALLAGRILGVALGLVIAWASNLIESSSTVSPATRAIWIVLLFVARGAALGLFHPATFTFFAAATPCNPPQTPGAVHIASEVIWISVEA